MSRKATAGDHAVRAADRDRKVGWLGATVAEAVASAKGLVVVSGRSGGGRRGERASAAGFGLLVAARGAPAEVGAAWVGSSLLSALRIARTSTTMQRKPNAVTRHQGRDPEGSTVQRRSSLTPRLRRISKIARAALVYAGRHAGNCTGSYAGSRGRAALCAVKDRSERVLCWCRLRLRWPRLPGCGAGLATAWQQRHDAAAGLRRSRIAQ